ncbi:bacteriorhodopsin [Deinococcus planocerae]|uniref:bacteriorhodopsin n=1 Tax=Deinococcus planocerae TaxID=1737569 RepID=UPI001CA48D34|nr:bacteriorhodopsin [Deinococcus planocerae]
MNDLLPLTPGQHLLILNALNLTTAFMGGAALLFVLLRSQVASAYRLALSLMAAAVGMAGYHYWQILGGWRAAYVLQGGAYVPTGQPFNDASRYADWLGTVPLILAALMLVLDIGRRKSASLVARLAVAAVLMIALGYVGEVQREMTLRAVWGAASCVPFAYILFVLWSELRGVLSFETPRVRGLFSRLRVLLVASWSLHPLVYALPLLGLTGAPAFVLGQVGHSVADICAKVFYGLMIYAVAREKTLSEELLLGLDTPRELVRS